MGQRFIVAEVSKNWTDGYHADNDTRLLAQMFEHIINVNDERGYRLHSFEIHRRMADERTLNETIIAVFERIERVN